MKVQAALASLLLLLTSCGYHIGQGTLPSHYSTISVPFVRGDTTGLMTEALIKELSSSCAFDYVDCGAELVLRVAICEQREENIGFRYDIDNAGNLNNYVIPNETRVKVVAEVTVVEASTSEILLGPIRIAATADFDHDYYIPQNQINVFSLGQVTDISGARDAVYTPLSRTLAQKIVDYISNAW